MKTVHLLILIAALLVFIYANSKLKEGFQESNIIGYFHVCQLGEWKRSFDTSMEVLKTYGLFDATTELRIGILNESGKYEDDPRFKDPKIKIIYIGKPSEYERPTLFHMRDSSFKDPSNTLYYYLHTKGIKHFNTVKEKPLLFWLNSMLDCNFKLWKNAVKVLETHDTYGCNYNDVHYVGNFWWATAKHIQKLPATMPAYYTAPEDWVLLNKENMYCSNNCIDDGNYVVPYPRDMYDVSTHDEELQRRGGGPPKHPPPSPHVGDKDRSF
jgi:hypothetical protein